MPEDDAEVLRRALDQLTGLLSVVPREALTDPTPCSGWTLQDLVDHIVATPARFACMRRGEEIDWSAPTPPAGDDAAATFRAHAYDLLDAFQDASGGPPVDWQCAEFAVHTWDLATALGRSTDDMDPAVAERGLTFMQANLTEDNRDPVFAPAQPAPDGANAYRRAAAFAGRSV